MLKHKEPNPLAVFNMRQMEFCPPHFETMNFYLNVDQKVILDWIYENTESRFFFGPGMSTDNGNRGYSINYCVAFENHSELSYFSLMLTQINKHQEHL